MTIKCVLLFSRQGKVRLSKWYQACSQQQQNRYDCLSEYAAYWKGTAQARAART